MKATVSLDSIWNLIQSLSLDNQKWLADKVYEEIGQKKPQKELVFPHIPAQRDIAGGKKYEHGQTARRL